MNELDAILSLCKQEPEAVRGGVLATVVHVEGSAYRRPGARMLILPDGRRIGTVSGGCLESDVTKKAWWFTENGHAALRAYDTSSGDDAVWEFGLGCNGVVHVLFERMDSPDACDLTAFLAKNRSARRGAAVATVVGVKDASRAQLGQRLLVETSGAVGGSLKGSELEPEIADHASACCVCRTSLLTSRAKSKAGWRCSSRARTRPTRTGCWTSATGGTTWRCRSSPRDRPSQRCPDADPES